MKRAAQGEASDKSAKRPAQTSVDDIVKLMNDGDFSSDQLCRLGNEITHLYSLKANRLSQTFPHDLWCHVLKFALPKYRPKITDWFPLRTVCKNWNESILKLDLSAVLLVPTVPTKPLNLSAILQTFTFSRFAFDYNSQIEPSLLNKVQTLRIHRPSKTPWWKKKDLPVWDGFSSVTQLTHLELYIPIPPPSLATLTNLRFLKLKCVAEPPTLKTINTLTNLTSLHLGFPSADQVPFKNVNVKLPNLISLSSNRVVFFQKGQGKCLYRNNLTYEGDWDNGRHHGIGVLKKKRRTYEGSFAFNKRHGEGTQSYKDGLVRYQGQWQKDSRQGTGKFYVGENLYFEGIWKNDHPKSGMCFYPNGDRYVGELKASKREGGGTYYFADGREYEITAWKNGKPIGTFPAPFPFLLLSSLTILSFSRVKWDQLLFSWFHPQTMTLRALSSLSKTNSLIFVGLMTAHPPAFVRARPSFFESDTFNDSRSESDSSSSEMSSGSDSSSSSVDLEEPGWSLAEEASQSSVSRDEVIFPGGNSHQPNRFFF